jgi:hypothetical protein
MQLDPFGHFRFDGVGQQLLSTLPQDTRENVLTSREWQVSCVRGKTIHGGVLLGLVGRLVKSQQSTKSTPPFFILLSTTFENIPRI